jgi:superfamily II RNA helicase
VASGGFDTRFLSPDAVYLAFVEWAESTGISLYPAQDEAVIEIVSGNNLILSTPTGTGKSLVAIGAHFAPSSRGGAASTPRRSRPS